MATTSGSAPGVRVLDGVRIGSGTIVGAGAVVDDRSPEGVIAAGSAKPMRPR